MKCLWCGAAGAAVLLVLTSAVSLFAAVVMVETSFGESPNGQISAQDRTNYVQENKQKGRLLAKKLGVEASHIAFIESGQASHRSN